MTDLNGSGYFDEWDSKSWRDAKVIDGFYLSKIFKEKIS